MTNPTQPSKPQLVAANEKQAEEWRKKFSGVEILVSEPIPTEPSIPKEPDECATYNCGHGWSRHLTSCFVEDCPCPVYRPQQEALPNPTTTGDNKTTDAKTPNSSIQEEIELRKTLGGLLTPFFDYSNGNDLIKLRIKLEKLITREKNKAVREEVLKFRNHFEPPPYYDEIDSYTSNRLAELEEK